MTTLPREVIVDQALERLRQQREAFEFRKRNAARWNIARLVLVGVGAFSLLACLALAAFIILNHGRFSEFIVRAAVGAVFVDVLGAVLSIVRALALGAPSPEIEPVTEWPVEHHQ